MHQLKLFPGTYSIVKLKPHEEIPDEVFNSSFFTITQDEKELSIIFAEPKNIQNYKHYSNNWKLFKLDSAFNFDEAGVLLSLLTPLSSNNIGIMAISSFDTDFVLVQCKDLDIAIHHLSQNYKVIEI